MGKTEVNDLKMMSLIGAAHAGEMWTPGYFASFLTACADGTLENQSAASLTGMTAPAIALAAREALESLGESDNVNDLPASVIRQVLCRYEDDDARPFSSRSDMDDLGEGPDQRLLVTRFGIHINGARIEGYLNLSGLKFERPLIFSKCSFSHSLNIANARLGPLSVIDSEFDDGAPQSRAHMEEYERAANETAGHLPGIMQNAQGLNAEGAIIDGYLDLTRLKAQRVDFTGARITGMADLEQVNIRLPARPSAETDDHAENIAVSFAAASAQHLLIRAGRAGAAAIRGGLNLTEARFGSIEIMGAEIVATASGVGSPYLRQAPWRAITARAVAVESDVNLSSYEVPSTASSTESLLYHTKIYGQIYFESAKIGGNVKGYGLKITNSLPSEFHKEIKRRREAQGKDPHGAKRPTYYYIDRELTRALNFRNAVIKGNLSLGAYHRAFDASANERQAGLAYLLPWRKSLSNVSTTDQQAQSLAGAREPDAIRSLRFVCDSEIDCRAITVSGDLGFEGCMVSNCAPNRDTAIDLRNGEIEGTLILKDLHSACEGHIDLREASARIYRDDFDFTSNQRFYRLANKAWRGLTSADGSRYVRWRLVLPGALIVMALAFARPLAALVEAHWQKPALLVIAFPGAAIAAFAMLLFGGFLTGHLYRFTYKVFHTGAPARVTWRHDAINAKGWPHRLRFVLAGFKYESFVIRDDPAGHDTSDDSHMPITAGARLRWLKHQPEIWLWRKFQPQPWVHCARILGEMGYDRQAHRILLRREERALWSENVSLPEKSVRGFLNIICGHGHAMYRLVIWGAVALSAGVFVNALAFNANLVRPTNAEILVDDDYKSEGALPVDYSSFRSVPYTFGRMLPLPPMAGRGEWAPCNRRHIAAALEAFDTEGDYGGACLPRSCNISERFKAASDAQHCAVLAVASHPDIDAGVDLRTGAKVLDILSSSPETARQLDDALGTWPDRAALTRHRLNAALSAGAAAPVNILVAFIGWTISVILATYAAGTLKRRE